MIHECVIESMNTKCWGIGDISFNRLMRSDIKVKWYHFFCGLHTHTTLKRLHLDTNMGDQLYIYKRELTLYSLYFTTQKYHYTWGQGDVRWKFSLLLQICICRMTCADFCSIVAVLLQVVSVHRWIYSNRCRCINSFFVDSLDMHIYLDLKIGYILLAIPK